MKGERETPTIGVTEDGKQFSVEIKYSYNSGGPSRKDLAEVRKFLRPDMAGIKGKPVHIIRSNNDSIVIFGRDRGSVIAARDQFGLRAGFAVDMIPGTSYRFVRGSSSK